MAALLALTGGAFARQDSSNAAALPQWEAMRLENWMPLWLTGDDPQTGERVQFSMAGPLVEQRMDGAVTWGTVRPFWIEFEDANRPQTDFHLLYPLFNYHDETNITRWDIFDLLRWTEFRNTDQEAISQTFWAFPFFFWRRSEAPGEDYTGIFPFAGNVKEFFFFSELQWSMFPLYFQTRSAQIKKHYLPFPFIQRQTGPGTGGWALWPLMGHFWREGKSDFQYMLWPLVYRKVDQFDKERPRVRQGVLPFYAFEKSENVTDWTYLWPFFGWREEVDPAYSETRYFWPLLVQGRGKKYINRWAPAYTHSIVNGHDKKWYMWPLIRDEEWVEKDVLIDREQFLYFLYWTERQTSLENPAAPQAGLTHVWPLYSHWDDGAGQEQFMFFSPLQVFFPHDRVIRHKYSPLFALWRYSIDDGVRRDSLLWDLVTVQHNAINEGSRQLTVGPLLEVEASQERTGFTALKGLLGWEERQEQEILHLLWQEVPKESLGGQGLTVRRGKRN